MNDRRQELLNTLDPDKIKCQCGKWIEGGLPTLFGITYNLCSDCFMSEYLRQQEEFETMKRYYTKHQLSKATRILTH